MRSINATATEGSAKVLVTVFQITVLFR